jgi:hypothetical protein
MDNTNSTTIINLIIFKIGTIEILNIKSRVLFPIMITTIGNRHRNIIEFRLISKNYNRSNMLRGRYRFLSPFTLRLLLLLLLLFKRERLEMKLLHIPWFIDRNDRRNFGRFPLLINKNKTHISPVIVWQSLILYKVLYVSICVAMINTIKMATMQDAIYIKNTHIYQRSFSR